MPRKQLQNMQLPESGYNPVVFQGYAAEGPEYDTNILANSIGRLDTAIEKANAEQGAVKQSVAKVRAQLNPALHNWFDNYVNEKVIKPMNTMIEEGNYGSAINFGSNEGANFIDENVSNALLLTEAYNKADEQAKKIIGTGEGYEWWKEKNAFDANKLIDENGNIVNADYFDNIKAPVERLNITSIIMAAAKAATPTKYDGKTGGVRKQGESLKDKKIAETAYGIIAGTPDGIAALEQEFEIYNKGLSDLDKQINDMKNSLDFNEDNPDYKDLVYKRALREQLLNHNGQKIDVNTEEGRKLFLQRLIDQNPLTKNLSYNYNYTFEDESGTGIYGGKTVSGGLGYPYNGAYPTSTPTVSTYGPNKQQTINENLYVNLDNVDGLFGQQGWDALKK